MINALIDILNTHENLIYEEFEATIEMLMGAIFIAVIAGFFIGMSLYNFKRVNGLLNLLTLPLRIAMFVLGGYPVIVLAVLLVPFLQAQVGTIIGIEAAQPVLMIWGAFYFASHLYRSFNNQDNDENMAIKFVKSLRTLVISMISASAVLGMIGMGGLGGILLNYGFFRYDYNFTIVIAIIYAVMILVVEFAALLLLTIFTPVRIAKSVKKAEAVAQIQKVEKEHLEKAQPIKHEPEKAAQTPMDINSLIRRR